MSNDVVLYVSEDNCRLVYRYDIKSSCASFKEQLLVINANGEKCAGLWINTLDKPGKLDLAVTALAAATPGTEDYVNKLKRLFLVLLDSGYSSMEVATELSPLLLKYPDLALSTYTKLKQELKAIENNTAACQGSYKQYKHEHMDYLLDFAQFADSLMAFIKSLLSVAEASVSNNHVFLTSEQRLFSRLNAENLINNRNNSPEAREAFDNQYGLVVFSNH